MNAYPQLQRCEDSLEGFDPLKVQNLWEVRGENQEEPSEINDYRDIPESFEGKKNSDRKSSLTTISNKV